MVIMSSRLKPTVILVTGGAGFLGQHIVGLLQSRAHHVTEIRILDVLPYVNKLEYEATKPVRQFIGSINDLDLALEACTGADCVMHVASIVDTSLIPDEQRSFEINVNGTETLIKACRQKGVRNLIYCSTCDVVIGHEDIFYGTEVSTSIPPPHKNFFKAYGPSKMKAEEVVLKASDGDLKTISIRPVVMYGELDERYTGMGVRKAIQFGSYFRFNCGSAITDHAYVGNVAWGFLCAERALREDDTKADSVSGNVFFIGDETPKKNMFEFLAPLYKDAGYKPSPIVIPQWLVLYPLYILSFILSIISIVYRVNFFVGPAAFLFMSKTYVFSYEKAKRLLGYKPLFTYEEAHSRSVKFLSSVGKVS